MTARLRALAAACLAAFALALAVPSLASASVTAHHHRTLRMTAYIWAAHQHGKWYCWGGTGPSCFDCSGLVSSAYRAAGIYIGRDTYDMLKSGKLIREPKARARKGDLAFFGTGHVELYAGRHYTLGAQQAGTRIGWHPVSGWWAPSAYYRVR